jgi:hypothetical protein
MPTLMTYYHLQPFSLPTLGARTKARFDSMAHLLVADGSSALKARLDSMAPLLVADGSSALKARLD